MPDIIVIGASAGGLEAVRTVVKALPSGLPASLFIVIHTSPEGPGLLAGILDRSGSLPAVTARNGMPFEHGHIYVAPPDSHLLVEDGHVRLSQGPREHRFRPAIDPLFRTAARRFGRRVIGVVLSGNLADGSHGLMLIKENGGIAIVQNPEEAVAPSMPEAALQRVDVDHVLLAEEIGPAITDLVMNGHAHSSHRPGGKQTTPAKQRGAVGAEQPTAEEPDSDALETGAFPGPLSPFTCPDCGGTLWEFKSGELVRYRCHVGHGFTEQSLFVQQNGKVEDALWTALRAIEESIELRKRMADRALTRNLTTVMPSLERDIVEYESRADVLRDLLLRPGGKGDTKGRRQTRQRQASNGRKKKR